MTIRTTRGGTPGFRRMGVALAVLTALTLPDAVLAQSASPEDSVGGSSGGSQLQDIVVTATRHSELLSHVPVSVSAFSQDTLDIKGIKDAGDVARYTPGVTIDLDGTNAISIRGISSSAGAATTGIYIDDTPIQMKVLGFNADTALPKTFDLERVEVLRGPQGTLFGAGAEGGALRYILSQPSLEHSDASAKTELAFTRGGAPSYEVGIAGGAPLAPNVLGVRGSLWVREDGGWIDRVDPFTGATVDAHANRVQTIAGRLSAKWALGEDFTITPSLLYQDTYGNDVSTYFPVLSDPGSGSYRNAWSTPRHQPDRFFLPSVRVEGEIAGASFTSNTSFFTRREQSGYDGTMYNVSYYEQFYDNGAGLSLNPQASCYPNCYPFVDGTGMHLPVELRGYRAPAHVTNQQQTFAQEFRLQSSDAKAPLVWTAGLFYSVSNETSVEEINDPMVGQFFSTLFVNSSGNPADYVADVFGVPLLANNDVYYNANHSRDRQVAVFGEGTWSVTDQLKLTLGLRYSLSDGSFDHFADGPQNYGQTPLQGSDESDRPFTPKASVSYQADPGNLFYATWAKGFRSGGGNALVPLAACAGDLQRLGIKVGAYAPDTVNSMEIGAKNRIGDHLQVASSLYNIRWNGIQQNIYLPCGFQVVANLAQAVARGGDIQVEWAPTQALDFDLAVGRTDAHNTQTVGGNAQLGYLPFAMQGDAIEGRSFGPTPLWTASLGAQVNFLTWGRKSFARVDAEFSVRSSATTPTEDPRTQVYDPFVFTAPSSSFVSLRAGTKFEHWTVSAFVDNLFGAHPAALDSSDYHSIADPYNTNPQTVLTSAYTYRPRTMGITATWRM